MASRRFPPGTPSFVRRTAAATVVLLAVTLTGPPTVAYAAAGPITTQGQGLRANIALLNNLAPLAAATPTANWTTGGAAVTRNTAGVNLGVPVLAPNVLGTGAITAKAQPSSGGGSASAEVLGLNLLSTSTVGADAVNSYCSATSTEITGGTDAANLRIAGNTVNPGVNTDIGVQNVLSGKVNRQTADWDQNTGRLTYTVQGLQLNLLSGLSVVAAGTVTVAESVCSGIVRLGSLTTTARSVIPGNSATPQVTVRNTGDIAAPGTVITIPAPPTGYTLGTPTVTGGGECTSTSTQIRCSGVTVPGGGSVVVSLPVTVNSSAPTAADWAPGSTAILARSTPVAAAAGTTIDVNGGGTLISVLAPQSGGTITIDPVTVPAGRTATTTLTLANQGPSDANTALTIPIGNRPAGLSIQSATVGGTPCTGLSGAVITCSGLNVPSGQSATVTFRVAAAGSATPGTVWNLENVQATLNGTPVTGTGRFATVSDPDVNLSGGVTINRVTGVPGGGTATPTVRVANIGMVPATGTTIAIPAPPIGYQVGQVTTTSGTGQCTSGASGIQCTGVTVPANGAITVTIPVTLASNVTASWTAVAAGPVTATSDDSTGQKTGPIVVAEPSWTLEVDSVPPPPGTVRPGQDTTMEVDVTDAGPSDAVDAEFVVVAPRNTTFAPLPLPSPAVNLCEVLSPATLRCTVDIPVDGDPVVLRLPLRVSGDADSPVEGGCASLNNDTDCADPGDEPLADIVLGTSLGRRLTVNPQSATITPGTSGTGRVRITSTADEDALTVTVPLAQLPTGFTATPAAGCTATATAITCTGVTLTANQEDGIDVPVAVRSNVVPPRSWTAQDIRVSDGVETITFDGTLAVAGPPRWDLTATVTGPADGTVQPGGTGTLTVVAHNEGPSDATDASFAVVAPDNTTFDPLTGEAARWCTLASGNSRAVCTVDLAANANTPQLYFVFRVPAGADPYEPIPGGCVDLDGQPGCGPDDEPLDPVVMGVPFDRLVALSYTTVTVTPGTAGNAAVRVTARGGDQNGLTVGIPVSPMPAGLSVAQVTAPSGATCQTSGTRITCTGVDVADDSTVSIVVRVAATPAAVQGTTWTAGDVTVARGSDQITGSGRLAVVGAPRYTFNVDVGEPGPLPPGGTTEVEVTVTNDGPSDAPPGPVSILAPDNTTLGDPPAPTSDLCQKVSDTRWTCTFGLPYGQPVVLKVPIIVDADAPPGDLPGGCLDADDNQICDGDDPELGPLYTATPFNQELSISTVPVTIAPGTTGNATVRLQAGHTISGLSVTIPLLGKPAQMATVAMPQVSTGASCQYNVGVAFVCTGVTVPAGGAAITLPVTVSAGAPTNLTWYSRALTAVNQDGDVAVGAGLLVRTGAPQYTLTATATGPADYTVAPGDTGNYQIQITNQGPSNATNGLVTIQAPYNTRWGDLTGLPIDSACDKNSDVLLVCNVTLAVGASFSWQLPVYVYPGASGQARISGGCVDLDGDSQCGGAADYVLPDWALRVDFGDSLTVLSDNPQVQPGTDGTTNFRIGSNVAGSNLTVRVLTAGLPPGLTAAPLGSCTAVADGIECTGVSFAAGQRAIIPVALTAAPDAVTGRSWTAAVRVTQGSDVYTRNVRAATIGDPEHELTVEVRPPAPGTLRPGGTGELDITVTNEGPAYYPGAVVEFEAPDGTTFVPPAAPLSGNCRRTAPTHVVCTFDLPVGPRNFKLVIAVPATATGPLGGGCVDRNGDNRCTQPEDEPFPPIVLGASLNDRITLSTTAGGATPGTIGTGYVGTDTDETWADATVVIPKTLPAGFTVTGAAGPTGSTCDYAGTEIRCTGVDVPAGETGDLIAITVSTASSLRAGVTWTAYSISLEVPDGTVQTYGPLLTTTTPVAPVTYTPDLAGAVRPGGTATLTVGVHNAGPSDALDQRIKIVAPQQTTFGGLSGAVATACSRTSSTVLTCRFDQTAQAADLRWEIPLLIDDDADPAVPLGGGCVSVDDNETCDYPGDTQIESFALATPLTDAVTVGYDRVVVAPGADDTARVVLTGNQDITDLTVTVGNLPPTFSVLAASADSGNCTVNSDNVVCTGVNLIDGLAMNIELQVRADVTATASARWRALVEVDDGSSTPLYSSGLLASVTAAAYDVSVTLGALTPNPASPGQTVTLPVSLHNNGPSNAYPYNLVVVLPTGTTHGPLPSGCTGSGNGRIVTCEVDIDADADASVSIPMVVDDNQTDGSVLSGGCLDNVGQDSFDYVCTGPDDDALPSITVSAPRADLQIRYLNPRPKAVRGGTVRLGLPYSNVGNDSASGVRFTIDPPDGVRVTAADILLDASNAVGEPGPDETVAADCVAADDGDANTVVCTGPDAPTGDESQLWMSLYIASSVPAGTYPITVEISTTSPEGNTVDNFAVAQLSVATSAGVTPSPTATPTSFQPPNDNGSYPGYSGGGGDNLPRTGSNVFSLTVFAILLIAVGVGVRLVARNRPCPQPDGAL
ncbi:hypothetical protein [Actinoplanes sp. NPDC049265]|uniref:hypothetical protein n=1 Tax=Actinoplanes sp. NPDC049265 TaxID=3363902 RepID=UPI0037241CF5